MTTPRDPKTIIALTERSFLTIVVGEYFVQGFFWFLVPLAAVLDIAPESDRKFSFFLVSIFVMWLSMSFWEILTGWYADKFQRRLSIASGFLFCSLGLIVMILALELKDWLGSDSFIIVWAVGISLWTLGPALQSGADEAWLIDRCNSFSETKYDGEAVFKKSNSYGIIATSIGAFICWITIFLSDPKGMMNIKDGYIFSFAFAAVVSLFLYAYSLRNVVEEYWSDPKYQTVESLFKFMADACRELKHHSFRWFTFAWCGATGFSYLWSCTFWPYLTIIFAETDDTNSGSQTLGPIFNWIPVFIGVQCLGAFLGIKFSRYVDRIKGHRLRFLIVSLIYTVPLILGAILIDESKGQVVALCVLLAVAMFGYRMAYAAVLGSIMAAGQRHIKSDDKRALLVSMASAFAALIISLAFGLAYMLHVFPLGHSVHPDTSALDIEHLWIYAGILCIVLLLFGGYQLGNVKEEE